jgi:protein ImuA
VTGSRSRNWQPLGNVLCLFYGNDLELIVNITSLGTALYRASPQPIQKLLHSLIHKAARSESGPMADTTELLSELSPRLAARLAAGLAAGAQNPAQTRAARSAVVAELRRLLPGVDDIRKPLPFGLPALDSHLPRGGLARGALHEIVPATETALPAAFGFAVALLAKLSRGPLIFILPRYTRLVSAHLSGHGLNSLGLDPARVTLVETAHRKDSLWAAAEALHSGVPLAVTAAIDRLDLKTSQKLQLAANDCGRPLFLIRPAPTLDASAAATRWRVGVAQAARDRFGLLARPRWHLQLERCRNGHPGEWKVEYDHVTHRFSLAAALADHALSRGSSARSYKQAGGS